MESWSAKRSVLTWMAIVLVVLLFFWALSAAVWGMKVATAGIYGRGEARIQIQSAPFRITAYDHFFNSCSSIQGLEGSIDALTTQYAQASDGRAKDIALTSLTGVKAARQQAIAKYNADARKDYTIGQFRDSDLPYQIQATNYPEEGRKTSCGTN